MILYSWGMGCPGLDGSLLTLKFAPIPDSRNENMKHLWIHQLCLTISSNNQDEFKQDDLWGTWSFWNSRDFFLKMVSVIAKKLRDIRINQGEIERKSKFMINWNFYMEGCWYTRNLICNQLNISYVAIEGSKNEKVINKGTTYNGTQILIFMFSFDGFVWWSRHSQWWEDLHPGIPHNHKEIRDKGLTCAK